jgi:NhaA family Na+:H+ antiporter
MLDTTKPARYRPASALRAILKSEAGGGLVLMAAAAVALAIANSPLAPSYLRACKTVG